ncbi:MAG: redoxin family protein [Sulfurovum sp.]|nr:redoxin family protein [Sulfurovum sp.]
MHKFHLLALVLLFLGLNGCEEKETEKNILIENCTVERNASTSGDANSTVFEASKNQKEAQKQNVCLSPSGTDTFSLSDDNNHSYTVKVFQKSIEIKEETRPITLVTFFASWCPPCLANIPYFNELEQKYNDKIFIASVFIHDAMKPEPYQTFLDKHEMRYFVSNSPDNDDFASLLTRTLDLPENFDIPLTVLYVHGKYFTHYEGAVPVEMLEYDIRQAIQTLE